MNESHKQHPSRKRRLLSGCLVILGTALLMLVIAWLLLSVLSERDTDALRAKGYPVTLSELNDWYVEPPFGENAAEYYLEAAKFLERSTFSNMDALPIQGDAELPPLGTPISEEMLAVIGAFLKHESQAFDLIDEGVQFSGVRYPLNFNAGLSMPFTHLQTVRDAYRGQQLRTLYLSGQQNTDVLLAEYEKLAHVARSLRQEPMLIACLVHTAMVRGATTDAERLLNENEFSREQLAKLDASLALLLDDDTLVRAFVGERCFGASVTATTMTVPVIGGYLRSDYLGAMDEFIAIAEGGLPEELDAYRTWSNRSYSIFQPLASITAPALARSAQSYYETHALIVAARAAITVQAWRLDGSQLPESAGAFPESVQQAWPIDPFSGKPLIYKRLDEGYIIYSVGGDMTDNGGDNAQGNDTVFRILR